MRNVIEIFTWAKERGDANIVDRIIVKALPVLLKSNMELSSKQIQTSESILVDETLFDTLQKIALALIEEDNVQGGCHV